MIACILDNVDILKFFVEVAKMNKIIMNKKINKEIELSKIIVLHDALNCFNYLFPDLSEESEELNELYNLAKLKNSENIIKAFEQDQINFDFDFDMFQENEAMTVI